MDTDDNRMVTTSSMITGIILSTRFRTAMTDAGFTVAGEEHAICPVCIFIEGMMRAVVVDKMDDDGCQGPWVTVMIKTGTLLHYISLFSGY